MSEREAEVASIIRDCKAILARIAELEDAARRAADANLHHQREKVEDLRAALERKHI